MRRAARLAVLLGLVFPLAAGARTPSLDFVDIAANSGGAAGGHTAIRLGDEVYHFQSHGDGLLRLDRLAWGDFAYRYTALENRELRVARVPVSQDAFTAVDLRFARLRVVQQRHLDRLSALELEARWLGARSGAGEPVRLRGAGLFDAAQLGDPAGQALRAAVEQRWGDGFLDGELRAVESRLQRYARRASRLGGARLEVDVYAEPAEIAAERLRDELQLREALLALRDARALADRALLELASVDPADPALSADERRSLEALAAHVRAAAVRLAGADRPGRGLALLVAAARHQALQRSLATGRLQVLDTLPSDAPAVDARTVARRRDVLLDQAGAHRRLYREARAALVRDGPDEVAYRRLEDTASRYRAIQAGVVRGEPVRVSVEPVLMPAPVGAIAVAVSPSRAGPAAVEAARANVARQRGALRELYAYGLFRHNCATELVRALNSAFPDDGAALRELGGVLAPGSELAFVPSALGAQVERRLAVAERRRLPSWRRRRVAELAEAEPPTLVQLRESNTWTSTVYPGTDRDGTFLFFTDGAPLLRPVLGALNLGFAAAHTAAGLASLPWDRGRRVMEALHGLVFSVPELFFVNIRKGSYDFVPQEGLPE